MVRIALVYTLPVAFVFSDFFFREFCQNVDRVFLEIAIIPLTFAKKKRAMAKNGSSRSVLGQKRVGRSMKAANTEFGLT